MRIGQISYHYLPIVGGQEVYISNLIEIFKRLGVRSRVYQRWRKGVRKSTDVVPVFAIPFIARFLKGWDYHLFNLFLFLIYGRELQNEDLIITHYAIHTLPIWNIRKEVIVLSHGVEWNSENPTIEDKLRRFIAKKSFDRFIIVANDTHYFRELGLAVEPAKDYFKEVAPQKWFIPNCVNTDRFKPSVEIDKPSHRKIILVPRQITKDRGIDLAIRAFRFFIDIHKDFDMLIAGNPSELSYFHNCVNLVKKLGLEDKVFFKSTVQHFEMPSLYSSAFVTLIPTLRREGTSLSALESMACGTPTVSTNIAGLRDLPTEHAAPTPEAICEKLLLVVTDRNIISKDQMQKVRRTFNLQNWQNAWEDVLKSTSIQIKN
jgi:glycosyltransferase involved in cell wall biosynthesis